MKKTLLTSIGILLIGSSSFAQNVADNLPSVEDHQFAYNLLTNFSFEKRLARKTTLYLTGPISGVVVYSSSTSIFSGDVIHDQSEWGYAIRPHLHS